MKKFLRKHRLELTHKILKFDVKQTLSQDMQVCFTDYIITNGYIHEIIEAIQPFFINIIISKFLLLKSLKKASHVLGILE